MRRRSASTGQELGVIPLLMDSEIRYSHQHDPQVNHFRFLCITKLLAAHSFPQARSRWVKSFAFWFLPQSPIRKSVETWAVFLL